MKTKDQLRKKFKSIRKKNYFNFSNNKFSRLVKYIKNKYKTKKKIIIAMYYPSNYEVNILNIVSHFKKTNVKLLLPKILDGNLLKFTEWRNRDVLIVNKFGIPEPFIAEKNYLPDVVLVPLLAFDSRNNRLGYGKGFYDKYLYNLIRLNKKMEAIGIAFSFQKYAKLPSSNLDYKLNKIFTEKGFQ